MPGAAAPAAGAGIAMATAVRLVPLLRRRLLLLAGTMGALLLGACAQSATNPCSSGALNESSCTITDSAQLPAAFNCGRRIVDGLTANFCSYAGAGSLVVQGPLVYDWNATTYVQLMGNASNALSLLDANLSAAGFLVTASTVLVASSDGSVVSVLNTSATGCGDAAKGSPRNPADGATHGGVGGSSEGTCYDKPFFLPPAKVDAVGVPSAPWQPLSDACGAGVLGGGAGGGIINITATGLVDLRGWLLANGGNATATNATAVGINASAVGGIGIGGGVVTGVAGGGAGGTVVVVSTGGTVELNKTARIQANGGATYVPPSNSGGAPTAWGGGGGGGGRIFLQSQTPWNTKGSPWSATASGEAPLCLCGGAGTIVVCVGSTCSLQVSNDNACLTTEGVSIGPTFVDITPASSAPLIVNEISVQKQVGG
jgi:hypothetical protein